MHKVLKIGAEARLTLEDGKLVKERIRKGYRLEQIDAPLRKRRTRREASLIDRARRAGVKVPQIFNVDEREKKIVMEFIDGERIDKILTDAVCKKIGESVAKLHSYNIIHGDLTTSNIIKKGDDVYFIDFGLGEVSDSIEKQGVDLKVLKESIRAVQAKKAPALNKIILDTYAKNYDNSKAVLERLEKIEKRGRYK
jgi:Kae1-associated kinase Bud32